MARSSGSAVARLLARERIDPFLEMARLAQDPDVAAGTRAYLWVQLARYCAPQLQSVKIIEPRKSLTAEAVERAQRELFGDYLHG